MTEIAPTDMAPQVAPIPKMRNESKGHLVAISIDDARRRRTESWKKDRNAFFAFLQDTLYDHLQIADELARDTSMEPQDRLRALKDFTVNAERILKALQEDAPHGSSDEYGVVEDGTHRRKKPGARRGKADKKGPA